LAVLHETGKDLTINKGETEDNMSLLLSVFDSLNTLCEKLGRLNYVHQRKNIEQILYRKDKGKLVSALRSRSIYVAAHAAK
jgi:hypothetical protein